MSELDVLLDEDVENLVSTQKLTPAEGIAIQTLRETQRVVQEVKRGCGGPAKNYRSLEGIVKFRVKHG